MSNEITAHECAPINAGIYNDAEQHKRDLNVLMHVIRTFCEKLHILPCDLKIDLSDDDEYIVTIRLDIRDVKIFTCIMSDDFPNVRFHTLGGLEYIDIPPMSE